MNSFIGNQPANFFENPKKQVSTSNSGTTISLDYPVTSVADIRLTINAVVQSYDNYSVSGSTLTVGGTLNNDRVEILFVGRTYGSIAPSDASVGINQLSATGTKSSSTFLAGDNSFKTVSGTTINNNADNKVITGSGTANTLEAESNFIYNGTIVGAGTDGANADLGNGLHVKIADSGGSVNANRSAIVVEGTGDHGMTIVGNNSGQGGLWFANQSATDAGQIDYNHPDDSMRFYTASSERMRIDDSGTLLVGATSSTGYNGGVWQDPDGISLHRANATGGNGALLIYSDDGGAKTNKGYWKCNGGIVNYQSNDGNLSDERLKKDITDAPSTWNIIKNLKVKNFKYKADTDEKVCTGLIAQETEAVDSSLVNITDGLYGYEEEQKDEKYKSIYNTDLYFKMLKTLQEAQTKIETLETEMTSLKARVKTLEDA